MPKASSIPKLTPCLWFDGQAEEAARFYCSVFPRSRIVSMQDAPSDYPAGQEGQVLVVDFLLGGQRFVALNGGPEFHFTPAISIMVDVASQQEYDRLTEALSAVREAEQCGWVTDRYGVSWQLVPRVLTGLISDPDTKVAKATFEAMMPMKRLDIAKLEAVAAQARGAARGRNVKASRPEAARTGARPEAAPRPKVKAQGGRPTPRARSAVRAEPRQKAKGARAR